MNIAKKFTRVANEAIDAWAESIDPSMIGLDWTPMVRTAMQCALLPDEASEAVELGTKALRMFGPNANEVLNQAFRMCMVGVRP